jgi:hypothetical protein
VLWSPRLIVLWSPRLIVLWSQCLIVLWSPRMIVLWSPHCPYTTVCTCRCHNVAIRHQHTGFKKLQLWTQRFEALNQSLWGNFKLTESFPRRREKGSEGSILISPHSSLFNKNRDWPNKLDGCGTDVLELWTEVNRCAVDMVIWFMFKQSISCLSRWSEYQACLRCGQSMMCSYGEIFYWYTDLMRSRNLQLVLNITFVMLFKCGTDGLLLYVT